MAGSEQSASAIAPATPGIVFQNRLIRSRPMPHFIKKRTGGAQKVGIAQSCGKNILTIAGHVTSHGRMKLHR